MCTQCKSLQAKLGEREIRIAQLERELATDRAFSGGLLWLAIAILSLGIWTWRGSELVALVSQPRASATQNETTPQSLQPVNSTPERQKKK